MTKDESRFATFYRAVVLAILTGWLLVIGKGLILPIFAAVISVYVLTTAADAMGRLPVAPPSAAGASGGCSCSSPSRFASSGLGSS